MNHLKFYFLIIFQIISQINCSLTEADNALMGLPEITCNPDTIEMKFKTKKRFNGKIYVQGHYNDPNCRVDYSNGKASEPIKLRHGDCDMNRQRMIQPHALQFSTVLVISFHPLFVTKLDKAFHINCLYRETVQTVNQQLEVSALPTEQVQNDMPMPLCTYTIRKDEIDGEILKYARVGDQVVHRWECDSEMYGLLVHSCYVDDGQGEKRMIIDDRGCHTDRLVLGDPTYHQNLNLAYRESYVFKFADRIGVRFNCEIRLCVKESGGCNGVTPPNCEKLAGVAGDWIAERNNSIFHRKISKRTTNPEKIIDTDLISQFVYVLDQDNEESNSEKQLAENIFGNSKKICLPNNFFIIFGIIFLILGLIVIFLTVYLIRKNNRSKTNFMDSKQKHISHISMLF